MSTELIDSAIVDSFIKQLPDLTFIPPSDHKKIADRLNSLLDESATRYKKTRLSANIWNYFFENSLKSFTTNLRGLRQLSIYFDQFIEYENFLFAVDNNYRDHTIHSIWVMLLGFFMLNHFEILKQLDYRIGRLKGLTQPKIDPVNESILSRQPSL